MPLTTATKLPPRQSQHPTQLEIRPQPGPQEAFLATSADIAIYGGAAGAGKTWALLMEPLRHFHRKGFGAVFFRRTSPQITVEGGIWDTSEKLYPLVGGVPKSTLEWNFPSGVTFSMYHMEHEKDRFNFDSSQIPFIGFDQLESFTKKQFFYMLSRNRSTCGVRPYIRGTCNPDPDSFLRPLLEWWLDNDTGLPILSRSGILRWMVVRDDVAHWGFSKDEMMSRFENSRPLSFTFIPGKLQDNPILMEEDPDYLAKLEALLPVEKQRLLYGNWNARETAGTFFRREWLDGKFVEPRDVPKQFDAVARYWDRAATAEERGKRKKGSATASVKIGRTGKIGSADVKFYVLDVTNFWKDPQGVRAAIKVTAETDGHAVTQWAEQDPGQAGKFEAEDLVRILIGLGFSARANNVRESKGTRYKVFADAAQAGMVYVVKAPWNEPWIRQQENFDGTDACKSDMADSTSGAIFAVGKTKRSGTW